MRCAVRRRRPVLQLGDEVAVKALGRTYYLRLAEVSTDYHRGACATLVDHSHFLIESDELRARVQGPASVGIRHMMLVMILVAGGSLWTGFWLAVGFR